LGHPRDRGSRKRDGAQRRLFEASQEWDLLKVLLVQVGLSLLGSLATNPTYNLPIFLFAIWAYHYHETNDPFKTFLALLSVSILLDIWWFILHGDNPSNESGFNLAFILNILNLLVKPFTVLSTVQALKNRGDTFNVGSEWTSGRMPGGLPYQTVPDRDDDTA